MIPKSFQEWVKNMADIGWALFRSYLYQCRNPLNYRVITKSVFHLRDDEGNVDEEIIFVGVVQDIPDVTDHSILHKWVVIKTFYGEWEEPYMPKVPIGEDDREFVPLDEFFERVKKGDDDDNTNIT